MEIIDKNFIRLSMKKQLFVISVGFIWFLIALISFLHGITNITESFLIFIIGVLYSEIIKLSYRLENLEKKRK